MEEESRGIFGLSRAFLLNRNIRVIAITGSISHHDGSDPSWRSITTIISVFCLVGTAFTHDWFLVLLTFILFGVSTLGSPASNHRQPRGNFVLLGSDVQVSPRTSEGGSEQRRRGF